MTVGRMLWYALVVFVLLIAIAAGTESVSNLVQGQYSQFYVYFLLSLFCFTFFLSSKPWLRTRQSSSISNPQSCPACEYSNPTGSMYCMQCGMTLRMSTASIVCSSCHREIQVGWRFCHFCGTHLRTSEETTAPPNPQ